MQRAVGGRCFEPARTGGRLRLAAGEDGGEAILYGTPTETGVFRLSGSVYDNSINGYITFDVTVTVIDPKATPTPSPSPTASPTPSPTPTSEPTATPEPSAVPAAAADTATATPEPTATPAPEMAGKTGGNVLVIVLVAVIAVLIAAGAVMAVQLRRSGRGGGSHRR